MPRLALAALLLLFAMPAVAEAQTGDIGIVVSEVQQNGVRIRSGNEAMLSTFPLGKAECDDADNVDLFVRLSNYPGGITSFDLWLGTATDATTGEDCALTESRTMQNRICDPLHLVGGLDSNQVLSFPLSRLTTDTVACDENGSPNGQLFRVYFLATGTDETQTPITASQYGYVLIRIDPTSPEPPVPDQTELLGDTGIHLSWPASSDPNMLAYRIYADASVGTDCMNRASSPLQPGGPAPTTGGGTDGGTSVTYRDISGRGVNQTDFDAASLGIPEGSSALIAITSFDLAENESVLSATICLTRVPTAGFCDLYGNCPQGCSCSIVGARDVASPAIFFALAGFAVILLLRVRRARRT